MSLSNPVPFLCPSPSSPKPRLLHPFASSLAFCSTPGSFCFCCCSLSSSFPFQSQMSLPSLLFPLPLLPLRLFPSLRCHFPRRAAHFSKQTIHKEAGMMLAASQITPGTPGTWLLAARVFSQASIKHIAPMWKELVLYLKTPCESETGRRESSSLPASWICCFFAISGAFSRQEGHEIPVYGPG